MLDGEDGDFHASCCIFGRVRVQGKGLSLPRYAEWSQLSASLWASFRRGVGRRGGQVRTGKTVTEVSKPDAFLAICSDGPRGRATVRTG